MSEQAPGFQLRQGEDDQSTLLLRGDWLQGKSPGKFAELRSDLAGSAMSSLVVDGSELGNWDSLLMSFLLQCHDYCRREKIH